MLPTYSNLIGGVPFYNPQDRTKHGLHEKQRHIGMMRCDLLIEPQLPGRPSIYQRTFQMIGNLLEY